MMSALHSALDGFSLRANANTNVRQLARAWRTQLYVQATDSPDCFRLQVADGVIVGIEQVEPPVHETLLLRGGADLLESMFNGQVHPLSAYTDGEIEIYGPQADQIKLDAISLLIWGA